MWWVFFVKKLSMKQDDVIGVSYVIHLCLLEDERKFAVPPDVVFQARNKKIQVYKEIYHWLQRLSVFPPPILKWSPRGKHRANRRPSSKQYSDLKFFCNLLEKAATYQGLDTSNHSPQNVRRMFEASENAIRTACGKNKWMDQLKWSTVVKKLWQQI
jgi:hypothetical protein